MDGLLRPVRHSGLHPLLARINYHVQEWIRAKFRWLRPHNAMKRASMVLQSSSGRGWAAVMVCGPAWIWIVKTDRSRRTLALPAATAFGADAGGQTQADICPHPDVLCRAEQCGRLLESEALAGSSGLALRSIDEGGDVALDEVSGLGVTNGTGQSVVAHGDGRSGDAGRT